MISLGFTKILRDLWHNRARTALVVLSIAVSVMAFGALNTARAVLGHDYTAAYLQAQPAQAILTLPDFDQKLIDKVSAMPEVHQAAGQRRFVIRVKTASDWLSVTTLARLNPSTGSPTRLNWGSATPAVPGEGQILLDTSTRSLLPAAAGQELLVETPDAHFQTLIVASLPNDLTVIPARFSMEARGYMSLDAAYRLGQPWAFNQLLIITNAPSAAPAARQAEIQRLVMHVVDAVEKAGYPVLAVDIPLADRPPLQGVVNALLIALQAFGFLIVLLAVLVVSNVAAALVAEQARQVGILKAIGSRSNRVLWIYGQMVLIIGTLVLLIALPLSRLLARLAVEQIARQLDSVVLNFHLPLSTWVALPLVSYGATFAAVIIPLWRISRLTVRSAFSDAPPDAASGLERIPSGSLLLRSAIRNMLRKRQRLFLNLLILSLSGAMFIAALNVRQELHSALNTVHQRRAYDIAIELREPVGRSALQQVALGVPGVSQAEGHLRGQVMRVLPDGAPAGSIPLLAVPPGSDFSPLSPVSGQWPPPENGILLSTEALETWQLPDAPDTPLGQALRIKAARRQANWILAGTLGKTNQPMAYTAYADYAALTRQNGKTNLLAVRLVPGADSAEVLTHLQQTLQQAGYDIERSTYLPSANAADLASLDILVYVLLYIVALTALVGGMGLASSLSISVIERTREIGILRSLGARPRLVQRLVLSEGLLIGLFSLPLAWLLAWPLTAALGQVLVTAISGVHPVLIYRADAALAWALLVCILALLSSWLPARRASRLSIRETLVYLG